jgi:hypothetical protein
MPCSKENKANFAALQLRGEALMWWDHFKTMQQGRAVTWDDFKQAFKSHHIPKGLMDRKMRELLALRQESDTMYRYAQKFNSLCQYGGHHVDTDAKKMVRFRDGLDGKLYELLNMFELENFHELMNKAISQEDAMKKAHRDKKRPSGFAPSRRTNKKFHFVKKNVPNPSQQSSTRRWTMKPPQGNLQGTSSSTMLSSRLESLMHPHVTSVIVIASIVVSRGTTVVIAPSPSRTNP